MNITWPTEGTRCDRARDAQCGGVLPVLLRDLGLSVVCCPLAARDSHFPALSPGSSGFDISLDGGWGQSTEPTTDPPNLPSANGPSIKHNNSCKDWSDHGLCLFSFPHLPIISGNVFLNWNNQLLGKKEKNNKTLLRLPPFLITTATQIF